MKITSILHPTDFSDSSLNAFRIATDLAKAYNARLLALHVYDSAIPPVGIAGTVPLSAPARVQREALDAQLRQSCPAVPQLRIEYSLLEGDPATVILQRAKEASCDLIVMGTHGRTGLGRLLMGSVAEMVVRNATCPVLVVRTPSSEASTAEAEKGTA